MTCLLKQRKLIEVHKNKKYFTEERLNIENEKQKLHEKNDFIMRTKSQPIFGLVYQEVIL